MMAFKIASGLLWLIFAQSLFAIQEKHLIIIRQGEAEHHITHEYNSNPDHFRYKVAHLTEKGQEQVKKTAELLLTYGFDNRNVEQVYVSPLPRARETAQIMADIGVYSKDKIHIEPRLIESKAGDRESLNKDKYTQDAWHVGPNEAKSTRGETNEDVRKRVLAFYDELVKRHQNTLGHVIVVTHGMPAMELIDALTKEKIRLELAQVYLLPLSDRHQLD